MKINKDLIKIPMSYPQKDNDIKLLLQFIRVPKILVNIVFNKMKKILQKKHQFRQVDFICLMDHKIESMINTINKQFRISLQQKHKKARAFLNLKMTKKLRFIQLMIMFQMLLQIICSKIQLIWVEEKVVQILVVWQTLSKILKITVAQVMLRIFLETVGIPFKELLKIGMRRLIINNIRGLQTWCNFSKNNKI